MSDAISNLHAITNETEYEAVFVEIGKLWGAAPDSKESDLLEKLSILVEEYEKVHYPFP